MESFKTHIVVVPKTTWAEKGLALVIIAIMFIPFAVGIFFQNGWLCLSLPIGLLMMFLFDTASGGKFRTKNWIQKDSFAEFTLNGVTLTYGIGQKSFLWLEMKETQLLVEGFDGEVRDTGTDFPKHLSGTENKLTFLLNNVPHEFNFYLKNAAQKGALKLFLQNSQLNAGLTRLTFKEK